MAKRKRRIVGPIPYELDFEKIVALVDTREQTPFDLSPLKVEAATLDTGDYSVKGLTDIITVERKSLQDLVTVVGRERERFEREVQRMLAYPSRLLVVEATMEQLDIKTWRGTVTPNAVTSSILSWQGRGLPVLMAGNHQRASILTAKFLYLTARKRWRESRGLALAVKEIEEALERAADVEIVPIET